MQWFAGTGLKSKVPSQRADAIASLAEKQTRASVQSIFTALADPAPEVRQAALGVLLQWRDENTVRGLIHIVRDPVPEIRARAITELGKFGARDSLAAVLPCLCDSVAAVRGAAAQTLALIGWVPETPPERALDFVGRSQFMKAAALGRVALELLLPFAENAHGATRRAAAEALGCFRDTQASAALEKLLNDADPAVRIAALVSLATAESKWSAMTPGLSDADPNVRVAAVDAIGQLRDSEAVPALLERLRDEHWEVRCAAANALALLGENSTVFAIATLFEDRDADVRMAAAEALGTFGGVEAIEPLVLAQLDPDARVRQVATRSIVRVDFRWTRNPRTHKTLPTLKRALRHDDYNVRVAAAELLERIFGIRRQNWRSASQDQEADRRAQAAELLTVCLWDDSALLRGGAAEALGQLRSRRSVDFLKVRMEDEDEWVRAQAVSAVALIENDPGSGWTPRAKESRA
jgi:HEAT repeat protein